MKTHGEQNTACKLKSHCSFSDWSFQNPPAFLHDIAEILALMIVNETENNPNEVNHLEPGWIFGARKDR